MQKPKGSEIWLVDLGITGKLRPCLVVSVPFSDTEHALVGLVPITTQYRDSRFLIPVPTEIDKYVKGHFLVQGLTATDYHDFKRRLCVLSDQGMRQVEAGIKVWLGMA